MRHRSSQVACGKRGLLVAVTTSHHSDGARHAARGATDCGTALSALLARQARSCCSSLPGRSRQWRSAGRSTARTRRARASGQRRKERRRQGRNELPNTTFLSLSGGLPGPSLLSVALTPRRQSAQGTVQSAMETSLPRVRRLAVSTRTFRRLALANARDAGRDRRLAARPSGSPARGSAASTGPAARRATPFPKAATTLRSSSRTGSSPASRSSSTLATWLASLRDAGRAALGAVGRRRDVRRHARRRRRSARSPSTTTSTRGSSARTSCSRSIVLALGVLVALEAWDVRGEARAARLRPLAAARRAPRAALLRRHRHARDRGRPALRQRRRCRASGVRAGGVAARPRDGRLRHLVRAPARAGSRRREPPPARRRSSCSACSPRRWPSARSSTGRSCRWWLVLIHVTLAAPSGRRRSRSWRRSGGPGPSRMA